MESLQLNTKKKWPAARLCHHVLFDLSCLVTLSGGLVVYTWTARASLINCARSIRLSLLLLSWTRFDNLCESIFGSER